MKKIELLAPGGDVNSVKAAIVAGADAVYCGLEKFNARNRAENVSLDNLYGIVRLAHENNCKVFLTLNILIVDSEIPLLINLLNKLVNTKIDGIIIQDFGVFYLLSKYFKKLDIHASTQLTTHNKGQICFLKSLNANRVNLSRELNIKEIENLTIVAHKNNVSTEVFVHGSYCISFSGICYISSVQSGKSGNRGRCTQPCREKYLKTQKGAIYPLNLKDNSAYANLKELANIDVDSIKIEGRIKEYEYVYTVVNSWRKHLDNFYKNNTLLNDDSDLHKVFNRKFSNSFLMGDINKDMFIDNPMSNSTLHLSEINQYSSDDKRIKGAEDLYKEKEEKRKFIKGKIDILNIDKTPILIDVYGKKGGRLKAVVKTPHTSFTVELKSVLTDKGTQFLNNALLLKKLQSLNDNGFYIKELNTTHLNEHLHIPFSELTALKREMFFMLNDNKKAVLPITLPPLKRQKSEDIKPKLSVLISSIIDAPLCNDKSINVLFQLPNSFAKKTAEFIMLFANNENLIPYFPSVLIDDDFTAAVNLLDNIKAKYIVTNNTGIAHQAYKKGIKWIAGPYLNITNSYSLLALKESFNCSGAFISNELNKNQIKSIKKPDNFALYYSIYHPIIMMTSRQCLFHQITGCVKDSIDEKCLPDCEKYSSITNLKGEKLIVEKSKGNFHRIYNAENFLNTDIITDIPDKFSGFLIDLCDVKTETKLKKDKNEIIEVFKSLINGNLETKEHIEEDFKPSNDIQYKKGI